MSGSTGDTNKLEISRTSKNLFKETENETLRKYVLWVKAAPKPREDNSQNLSVSCFSSLLFL